MSVGQAYTTGFARDVALAGSHAYIADEVAGLRIFNVSDPTNPVGDNSCFIGPRMSTDDMNSLIEQHKAKLAALRAKGIGPFQNKFTPTESCKQARDDYVEGREVALSSAASA